MVTLCACEEMGTGPARTGAGPARTLHSLHCCRCSLAGISAYSRRLGRFSSRVEHTGPRSRGGGVGALGPVLSAPHNGMRTGFCKALAVTRPAQVAGGGHTSQCVRTRRRCGEGTPAGPAAEGTKVEWRSVQQLRNGGFEKSESS